ncbi:MAG: amidohydrolase family protein [Gemmatimonadales bacterium]
MKSFGRQFLLGAALVGAVANGASAQWKQQVEPGTVDVPRGDLFVTNIDAIWSANDTVYRHASILIRDGLIRAIGEDLKAPNGAVVIDGTGMTAIPGLVDEHSHIAMRATNEGSSPVVPEVRVIDALNPDDFGIYRALSGGVTTAQILHGSSNPIGGQSAIIKTRWGMENSKQLLVQGAPQTVKFALGENVTRKNFPGARGSPRRFPASRAGVEAVYVQAFTAAQEYKRAWQEYRSHPKNFRVAPRRDLRLEALVDIMDGRIRVHAHSYRSDEIVMLMNIADRFGFKIDVFTHVLEGYKVADEMAAHGAGGSTFSDWWQYKLEAYDATPYNAAVMHDHGVVTSINSDIPWLQSFMVYEFNKPVKYGGVSKEDALRMLTLNPARQLLIDDKVGSLEVGKQADLVLLSGDPFDSYSRVEKTIVDGIVYYDLQKEEETRRERVRRIRERRLIPDEAASISETGTPLNQWSGGAGGGVPQGQVTALRGGTVHTVSGPDIPNGTILISNGKITAVGPESQVQIPAGANVVDVSGKHIYPGMIDLVTQLGMVEIASITSARDDQEIGRFNPHIRAITSVHPQSEAIPVARANGITTAVTDLGPRGGTVIPGTAALIQLSGDTQQRMTVSDHAALSVNFPAAKGKAWDEPKLEGERLEELVQLFERATVYAENPSTNADPTRPFEANLGDRENIMLDAMVPAVTGEIPVFFSVRRERDIKTLFLFLDRFSQVNAVIVGGDQAFRVADELAQRGIPVVVGSALSPTMDRDDPITAGWRNAGILNAAGVKVSFGTNSVADVRNLPYHAAKSVAFGLPKEEALKAVTLNAADILGMGDRLGSVDVGKRADLIVTDGDPLQIVTHVERAFIAGEEVSLESRHTRLWKEYRNRH